MKKKLLLLLMIALACSTAMAAGLGLTRDPNSYEGKNGINIRSLWLKDRFHYGTSELGDLE